MLVVAEMYYAACTTVEVDGKVSQSPYKVLTSFASSSILAHDPQVGRCPGKQRLSVKLTEAEVYARNSIMSLAFSGH